MGTCQYSPDGWCDSPKCVLGGCVRAPKSDPVLTNELTEYAPDWMDGSFDVRPGGGWYKAEYVDPIIEQLRGNLSLAEEGLANYALEVERLRNQLRVMAALGDRREAERTLTAHEPCEQLPHLDTCGLKYGGPKCTCGLIEELR